MKNRILNGIINSLRSRPTVFKGKSAEYHIVCNEINQAAMNSGHPFVYFDGNMCLFTGLHLERIEEHELKVFMKYAFAKLCGDYCLASRKETVNGLAAQMPYTAMMLNVKQATGKINFMNGTLDLGTMKLGGHNWQDYFRYVLPYGYSASAQCPMFFSYLNEVVPEKECRMVLAEYIGWLFMPNLKLEKVLFLYGSGCNGKSVFVDIIEALVGKGNISHESLSDLCGEYGANSRSNLAGKLLNTCSDVAPNAFAGDLFKRIASGEPISTKILYKDVPTLTDYARMMFCLNELPRTRDNSNGFFRRFLIAPFNVRIPKSRIDPDLARKITSAELPGIMNWVLQGWARLAKNRRFTDSPMMDKALYDYRTRNSKARSKLLLPPFV